MDPTENRNTITFNIRSWNKTEVEVEHLEKVGAAPQSKGGFIAK